MVTTEGAEIWIHTWRTDSEGEWYDRISTDGVRIGKVLFPANRRLLLGVDEGQSTPLKWTNSAFSGSGAAA